jgi:hypothetical protein
VKLTRVKYQEYDNDNMHNASLSLIGFLAGKTKLLTVKVCCQRSSKERIESRHLSPEISTATDAEAPPLLSPPGVFLLRQKGIVFLLSRNPGLPFPVSHVP